jgi:hypothetical protein
MSYVPLPLRVAVGLMATAVEQAFKLPEQLAELPLTAASRVVQAGMRVQQRITELAIKGDEVFSLLRPVEDTPPWATFDEDGEPPPPAATPSPDSAEGTDSAGKARNGSHVVPHRGTEIDEADMPVADAEANAANTTLALLAEYDEMSLSQLRPKLRGFSLAQLEELLAHEQTYLNRAAFITLLSNRISSVRSQ